MVRSALLIYFCFVLIVWWKYWDSLANAILAGFEGFLWRVTDMDALKDLMSFFNWGSENGFLLIDFSASLLMSLFCRFTGVCHLSSYWPLSFVKFSICQVIDVFFLCWFTDVYHLSIYLSIVDIDERLYVDSYLSSLYRWFIDVPIRLTKWAQPLLQPILTSPLLKLLHPNLQWPVMEL